MAYSWQLKCTQRNLSVGMYPVLMGEVRLNADLARKYSLFDNA